MEVRREQRSPPPPLPPILHITTGSYEPPKTPLNQRNSNMLLMEVRLIYWFETFRTSVNFSLLGTVCTSLHSNTLLGSWNDLEHSEKPQDVFRSFKSLSYHKHSRIIVRLNYGVNYQDNCKACNCMGWIIICDGNPSDHANDFVHFKQHWFFRG